jgi:hypothetical protein
LVDATSVTDVPAALTVCGVDPVLPAKVLSPAYTALMEWGATASEAVVKVAWAHPVPPPLARVPGPRVTAPSLNTTEPVGTVACGGFPHTVSVNVTDWPYTDELGELMSVERVGGLMVTLSPGAPHGDVAVLLFVSPL